MTRAEKEEKIARIQERLFELAGIMSKSDAHASKCTKLGISYKDNYPNEYKEYIKAREDYNSLENEIITLESVEVEEEIGGKYELSSKLSFEM